MSDQVTEMGATYLVEAADSTLPIGYKQTEVGVIPEEWEVKKLKEISPSQSVGLVINPSSYYSNRGTIPMLVGSHIYENRINWTTANRITTESNAKLPASRLYQGDLVTVRVGDPGVTSVIPPELDQSNCASMMIVRQGDKFNSQWLCFLMNSSIGKSRIEGVQYGTAQKQFNIIDAVDFLFPFPPKQEQTAIANALSDVDALTSELEKLVAKKQAIKTATMQQLLTGRSRLPQFALHEDGTPKGYKQSELGEIPEDWEVKDLGELFEPSISRKLVKHYESVSFVGMQDTSESAQLINQTKILFGSLKGGLTYFEKGDVLVAKITPCFENGKGCHTDNLETDIGFGSTEFHILRATEFSDSQFIYFWTTRSSFRVDLESEMVGSAGHRRVPLSAIASYRIPCTKNKEEQTAIATTLSDMDDEIQSLEHRLGKTRQIKQGMMQELLTGKTRLVKPANSIVNQ